MSSEVTKTLRKKYWLTTVASWVLTFLPLLIFTIWGFVEGTPHKKLALGGMIVVAIILTVINVLMKLSLRCIPWIVLIGIYICLKEITVCLVVMAVCSIVDELLISPLSHKYREKLVVNKEIDKRG